MKKEKIILVLNGKLPKKNDLAQYLSQYTAIFCADGAANKVIKIGSEPYYIMGDLDSVSKKNKINYKSKIIELNDQNLFVRAGDFVLYGGKYYEIMRTYNDTRYYFGQVEHKFQVSADCRRARRGLFDAT